MFSMNPLLLQTRRHFFQDCAVGLGSIALASLLNDGRAKGDAPALVNPLAPKKGHYAGRAKHVIFLFMAGGPSQLELFDHKPKLAALHGKPIPDEFIKGKRFAFMDTFTKEKPKLLATRRKFAQHGQAGTWVSDCLPHTAGIVDDLAVVRSMATNVFNHAPAKIFLNTGSPQAGRPSMGAWVTYGIGSESSDLPGFVVLQSGPRGPRGGHPLWGSGFLPTTYQGVPFRSGGEPILNLTRAQRRQRPAAAPGARRPQGAERGSLDGHRRSGNRHAHRLLRDGLPHADERAGTDRHAREDKKTLAMYGAQPGKPSFANNCLLARRLVERGVRFVQLYHTDWDHHGSGDDNLTTGLDKRVQGSRSAVRRARERPEAARSAR